MEDVGVPTGATPDPDNAGWYSWGDFPRGSFAAATGRLLFKPDGPGRGADADVPDRGAHEHGRLDPRRRGHELHRHVAVRRRAVRRAWSAAIT